MKTISAICTIAIFGAAVGLALADCTVVPNESCLSGPCGLSSSSGTSVVTSTTGTVSSATSSGAGGGDGGPAMCQPNPATGDYPCAIFDILHRKCHPCHSPDQLAISCAPFSLLTWEDSQVPFIAGEPKLRYMEMDELTTIGGSPQMPFGCSSDCPPSGDLGDVCDAGSDAGDAGPCTERAILDAWLSGCALPVPEGTNQKCTELCDGVPCVPQ